MIEYGHGNLLMADVDALVNTVNTVGVMGKGIALQFKRAFPANYHAYRAACARGGVETGRMFVFDTGVVGPRRFIVNFPTKRHWRNPAHLTDIARGLDALVDVVRERRIASIAIPALGCGNGGLAWDDVQPLIEEACSRVPEVRAVVFAPDGPPNPSSMPNATARPRLTSARAQLLVLVGAYLKRAGTQEVREGISELEIQKLAYFLQELGAPLRLQFVRGTYGPYAPGLSHVLDALEGHYLVGSGDRSARVTELAPINPTPGSIEAAREVLVGEADAADRIDALLALVDGFETPYSVELLATVHFASVQKPPTGDPARLADRVAGWSLRKARLFTEFQVRVAASRLADRRLLPCGPDMSDIPL